MWVITPSGFGGFFEEIGAVVAVCKDRRTAGHSACDGDGEKSSGWNSCRPRTHDGLGNAPK